MQNRLTEILGVEYPIIQGGMFDISLSRLVAAVSNAGGLGTLGQRIDIAAWHEEIKKIKKLTEKPFSVNLPMHMPELEKKIQIILDEGVKIVTTAAGNPARAIGPLKEAGVKVMHLVASADQAKKVGAAGVDVIIAEGGESGGMVAKNRVSTLVLVPLVVDAVKIPVVAAGGIGDARGLIAALAMGAEGVQLGTIFEACEESNAPDEWKDGVLKAKETDTIVIPRGPAQARVLKDDIQPGEIMLGQVSGLVKKIEKAGDIIKRMKTEIEHIFKGIEIQIRG